MQQRVYEMQIHNVDTK